MSRITSLLFFLTFLPAVVHADDRPNIILVMADDMGWGQTGYYDHPVLKTPNLDAMAANGLRFDRFYANGPVCSPTRATVLTGRQHDRTGVPSHGHALRLQEQTIAHALSDAGYVTGHFGKWHLNGIRGPGVPVLGDDPHSPGGHGFQEWVTVTNFFDVNPVMSRMGEFEEFEGDSSEIVVDLLLEFLTKHREGEAPLFGVVWYGTPHNPFKASEEDMAGFEGLDSGSRNHYGELVAMDRSIGTLRQGLRDLDIAENTIVLFCSDNGGLGGIKPETVGGLKGNKGSLWEGGIRVPAILEWPAQVEPRVTDYPASTMDIFPTVASILGLPATAMPLPLDGESLVPLLEEETGPREEPIPFRFSGGNAVVDNEFKLVRSKRGDEWQLYQLDEDPAETTDVSAEYPEDFARLKDWYEAWDLEAIASIEGKDYPEGRVNPGENPAPRFWMEMEEYEPYFDEWRTRWEYEGRLKNK